MAIDYNRVGRGMVFYFDLEKTYGLRTSYTAYNGKVYSSHIQRGYRPYLVTSINKGNYASSICNIVPITSEEKPNLPTHVKYIYEGKWNTILLEQPITVDTMALEKYMCTLSDEVMIRVEQAITVQQGIRPAISYVDLNLKTVINHLEEVVSKIIQEKLEGYTQKNSQIPLKEIENAAIHLGEMLEDLCGTVSKPEEKNILKIRDGVKADEIKEELGNVTENIHSGASIIEESTTQVQYPVTGNPQTQEQPKKKRNTWSVEAKRTFLKECEQFSPREIQKKYGFKNLETVFQMKYHHRNSLKKLDEGL